MDNRLETLRRTESTQRNARATNLFSHHSCGVRGGGKHRGTSLPLFRPGQVVPESGIYEVIHDADHRQAHDAVMIMGNRFPSCDSCEQRVRFRIVRTAPYIFQDQDFEEQ